MHKCREEERLQAGRGVEAAIENKNAVMMMMMLMMMMMMMMMMLMLMGFGSLNR